MSACRTTAVRTGKGRNDMGSLQGKTAVVTGGSAGIGRSIAEAFLAEGAAVLIGSRSQEKGDKMLAELGAGERARFLATDVTRQEDVERLVDAAHGWFGRLDIAVLNAGGVRQSAPILEMTDDEWQFELDVNLNHTFWGLRRSLGYMVAQSSGRVICMSSVEGKRGRPGIAGYATNKAAIITLVKAVAHEVGKSGVTVNALCPGLVVTDLVADRGGAGQGLAGVDAVVEKYSSEAATGRPVTLDEVASLAVFIAGDAASGITGQALSVDGGTAQY
ncbi:SDR family NAD(P)-dependent oxidoreductase [Prauserella sp. PE36]|uniref:SDR family NAD(P)-dependent oxidoreductase n=1 Tax=Prauserella sp. PE36 TaxID=1504709 RepID=UPI0018F60578|nr:SDR family NAD(P)-dependent oxidoreductase [Prauserella sp. PE36]